MAWWCNGYGVGLRLRRSQVRLLALRCQVTALGKLFAHVCLCHQAGNSVPVKRQWCPPYGWEGNRGFGIALAMHHRLRWFIDIRAHDLRKGDEHPAYTPSGVWHNYLTCIYNAGVMRPSAKWIKLAFGMRSTTEDSYFIYTGWGAERNTSV